MVEKTLYELIVEALEEAKAQFEILVPLNVVAPSVNLPSQKLVLDLSATIVGAPLSQPGLVHLSRCLVRIRVLDALESRTRCLRTELK